MKPILMFTKQDHNVYLFVFASAAIGFGSMGISAVLINLYLVKLGFDLTYLGIFNASGMVSFALLALPAGWFGARFGLRGSLILGYSLIALWLALFLSLYWFPRPVWATGLLICFGFVYAGGSLVSVNSNPYLMAICPEKDRHTAFTLVTAVMVLFAFLGALVAGFLPGILMRQTVSGLSEASAYQAVMWLNVLGYCGAVTLLLKARAVPPLVRETKVAEREAAPIGLLTFMGLLFSLQVSSENSLIMFLNIYFSRNLLVSTQVIGVIFGIARLLPFFLSPLQPLVLNRQGAEWTMNAGYLLISACAAFMALVPTWEVTAVTFLLISLATSFTGTARNLFGQQAVQPRWRTVVGAVATISSAIGSGLVGFGASWLIAAAGFRGLFLSGATMAMLAVLLYGQRMLFRGRVNTKTQIIEPPSPK